jgi:16S rRNA (cytidine1402-2'-O)-methyltransferase
VATPIGNLEDISLRALRILGESTLIAAEDTRVTHKLLDRYGIKKPLISYHEHNHLARVEAILNSLAIGDVAVVSDAGTPGLNDPGLLLVQAVLEKGYQVCPVPGPSAPIAALISSGLATDQFLFLGYFPRRKIDRLDLLESVKNLPYTLIFLEVPHRLNAALDDMYQVLGDRMMACARELTKIHEEILRGRISDLKIHFTQEQPRGEFTLVVAGANPTPLVLSQDELYEQIQAGIRKQISPGELAHSLSGMSGMSRRDIYKKIMHIQKEMRESSQG